MGRRSKPLSPKISGRTDPARLRTLDGRRREAERIKEIKAEMTAHLGGNPTAPQKLLIDRLAVDLVPLEALDARMALGEVSEHDTRVARALRGSVRLCLRDLHEFGKERKRHPRSVLGHIDNRLAPGPMRPSEPLAEALERARRDREAVA
jgi:hypothetical protein